MARSPRHYQLAVSESRTMTRAMTVGAVTDCLVFGQRGVVVYDGKRDGKRWDEFRVAHASQIKCIQSEYDDAKGAAEAVLADPVARQLLDGCEYQLCVRWEAHGLRRAAGIPGVRGGIDAINRSKRYLLDLKVTASTEPSELSRHVWKMLWHAQIADYVDAMDGQIDAGYLLCAEAAPPHVVTVLRVTPRMLDEGRKSIALWSGRLRACIASGEYPGYVQDVVDLEPPAWLDETEGG
jgi:hypothetical protein